MTATLSIAVRNLWRNRRRSLTTGLAVGIGTVAILLFGGFTAAVQQTLSTSIARTDGHLQIAARGYADYGASRPGEFYVEAPDALIARLAAEPGLGGMIRVATPVLRLQGIAGNFAADASKTFLGLGLRPEDHNALQSFDPDGVGGMAPPLPMSGAAGDAGVVGVGMARMLALCEPLAVPDCPAAPVAPTAPAASLGAADATVADLAGLALDGTPPEPAEIRIDLLSATVDGAPNLVSLRPIEARRQALAAVDDAFVALPLPLAQQLVHGGADRATAVLVQVHDPARMAEAKAAVQALIDREGLALEVRDMGEVNPMFGRILAMFRAIFGFLALIIGIVVLFTVANTMTMTVMERVGEVGTIRALGLRRSGVVRQFLAEGAMLGAAGCTAGVLAALALGGLVNGSEITWTPPSNAHPTPVRILLDSPVLLGLVWAAMAAVAAASAWLPARRAARMPVVDALRHT